MAQWNTGQHKTILPQDKCLSTGYKTSKVITRKCDSLPYQFAVIIHYKRK